MTLLDSRLGPVTIEPATRNELGTVMDILQDAAAWLVSRSIDQWPSPIPPDEYPLMAQRIDDGRVYLARLVADGRGIGTLYFRPIDPELWHDETGETATYIHSFAVHRSVRGHGIGAAMLKWAKAEARALGKTYLRLDCVANNPALHRYYEAQGMVPRGIAADQDYLASLYEVEV